MQTYKESKEKDYDELKKKFEDFLKKYKMTMKKFASYQVKNLIDQKKESKKKDLSFDSLNLSSDDETSFITPHKES